MKNSPPTETRDPSNTSGQHEPTTRPTDEIQFPEEDELPLDVIFSLLKNRRRRLVLRYLLTISKSTTLSDLAEHIAAVEHDKPEDELTSSERKRVYVCLYQCHLPKMADAEIIEFESDRGTVDLAENVDQLTPFLDITGDDESTNWPMYYGAIAILGGGLFLSQQLFFPSEIVSGLLMGVFVGVFLSLAVENAFNRGIFSSFQIRHQEPISTDPN